MSINICLFPSTAQSFPYWIGNYIQENHLDATDTPAYQHMNHKDHMPVNYPAPAVKICNDARHTRHGKHCGGNQLTWRFKATRKNRMAIIDIY